MKRISIKIISAVTACAMFPAAVLPVTAASGTFAADSEAEVDAAYRYGSIMPIDMSEYDAAKTTNSVSDGQKEIPLDVKYSSLDTTGKWVCLGTVDFDGLHSLSLDVTSSGRFHWNIVASDSAVEGKTNAGDEISSEEYDKLYASSANRLVAYENNQYSQSKEIAIPSAKKGTQYIYAWVGAYGASVDSFSFDKFTAEYESESAATPSPTPTSTAKPESEPDNAETVKYSFASDAVQSAGAANNGDVYEWKVTTSPEYFFVDTVDFDNIEEIALRWAIEKMPRRYRYTRMITAESL